MDAPASVTTGIIEVLKKRTAFGQEEGERFQSWNSQCLSNLKHPYIEWLERMVHIIDC